MWVCVVGAAVLTVFMAQSLLVIFGGMVFAAMIDGGARLVGRVLKIGRGWRIAINTGVRRAVRGRLGLLRRRPPSRARRPRFPRSSRNNSTNGRSIAKRARGRCRCRTRCRASPSQIAERSRHRHHGRSAGLFGGLASLRADGRLGIYIALEPRLYERGIAWMLPAEQRDEFYVTASRMARKLRHLLAGGWSACCSKACSPGRCCRLRLGERRPGVPMAALLGLITGLPRLHPQYRCADLGRADGAGRLLRRHRHGALYDLRLFRRPDARRLCR